MLFSLAMSPWALAALTLVFLLISVLLVLTVLIQRPQGGGLSGAFGAGASSGQTAFGAKTGDALTIFTVIIFLLFVTGSAGLNILLKRPANTIPIVTPVDAPGAGATGTGTGAGTTEVTPPATTPIDPAANTPIDPAATPQGEPAATPAPEIEPVPVPATEPASEPAPK